MTSVLNDLCRNILCYGGIFTNHVETVSAPLCRSAMHVRLYSSCTWLHLDPYLEIGLTIMQ